MFLAYLHGRRRFCPEIDPPGRVMVFSKVGGEDQELFTTALPVFLPFVVKIKIGSPRILFPIRPELQR